MSTQAEVEDAEHMAEVLASVRSDGLEVTRRAWAIIGHVNNNQNKIHVVDSDASEGATLADLVGRLEDDQVMYALLRLTTTHDMSTTVKFVYIHWVGDNVPFARRGRFGVVHGSVVEHFQPHHLLVETGSRDDLEEDALIQKLEESSGTRSHVIEWSEANKRQERGFTQHQVKREDNRKAKVAAPEGLSVEVDPELQQAIGAVRDDGDDSMWVVAGFQGGNIKSPLGLVGRGSGGIEELKDCLQDDLPMYGLYRTSDVIDGYSTVKFVYIYWIGENTRPLLKGKVSSCAGPIEKLFSPMHASLSFTSRFDIEEETIKDKVMAGSGSKLNVK